MDAGSSSLPAQAARVRTAAGTTQALSAWAAAGNPADQRDEVTARIDDLLEESDTPLADPFERFRDTRERDLDYAAVVEAGANFLRACIDHGWEPAEG